METNEELKHDIFLCTLIKMKQCCIYGGIVVVPTYLNAKTRCSVNNKTFPLLLKGLIAHANAKKIMHFKLSLSVIVWKQQKAHPKSGDIDDGRLLKQLRSPWNEIN